MIYFTSDLHFCHDREFVYKPRGFDSVQEMNDAIIERWNSIVNEEDDVYVLGDLMLNDNNLGVELVNKLHGRIHVIIGNHDTDSRINMYKDKCDNIETIQYALRIKYGKYHLYLSHYPTITCNLDESHFSEHMLNLYGHTHQQTNFFNDNPFMYHVGVDSHNCTPVHIEEVIADMKIKYKECGDML